MLVFEVLLLRVLSLFVAACWCCLFVVVVGHAVVAKVVFVVGCGALLLLFDVWRSVCAVVCYCLLLLLGLCLVCVACRCLLFAVCRCCLLWLCVVCVVTSCCHVLSLLFVVAVVCCCC